MGTPNKQFTLSLSDFIELLAQFLIQQYCNEEALGKALLVGDEKSLKSGIRKGFIDFLDTSEDSRYVDEINFLIRLLKNFGFNNQLEPDGKMGKELINAINTTLKAIDQKPLPKSALTKVRAQTT